MSARKTYHSVAAFAALALVGALLVAGCKKSEDSKNRPSGASDSVPRVSLTGTVECDGKPVPFGYVVFGEFDDNAFDPPTKENVVAKKQNTKKVPFAWAEISEEGTYKCGAVPVGDVKVMVITDPDGFLGTVDEFLAMNKAVDDYGKRGAGKRHDLGAQQSITRTSPSNAISVPSKGGVPSVSPPDSGSGVRVSGSVPQRPSTEDIGIAGPGGSSKMTASQRALMDEAQKLTEPGAAAQKSVEKSKKTLDALPDSTKELLEKINKKYGVLRHAELRKTITEGQKELNLILTLD